jgi:3-dehydroquinate dehydratase/shikimate dehydrogenase
MQPRLCETVTGHSMADLLTARNAATAGDMVELRLDGVADLDVDAALRGRRVPAVVTCRPAWEGGRFDGSEEERCRILRSAVEGGAEYVDVEWKALESHAGFRELARRRRSAVLVSMHDFDGVPHDLDARVRAMRATGGGTIKVAVTVERLDQTLPLRSIAESGPAVVIAMGEAGLPSRLLPTRFGSAWTYAGNAVAPGQIPARRMIDDYGFRRVGPSTRLFGVVSTNALHSLSPVMHNASFGEAGIDAVYVPLTVRCFEEARVFAEAMGVEGMSITIPFKLDALQAASRSDDLARRVGAANTLRRLGPSRPVTPLALSGWEATNTDVDGFLAPLETALGGSVRGMRASVLGAGGSARAVVCALVSRGAAVTVHARRPEQASEVASAFGVTAAPYPPEAGSWDLLVNCTPLGGPGLRGESPLPRGPFDGRLVYDLTYGPEPSLLLREARAAGCATLDGRPMLVAQAARQFEWWTGQRPGTGVMERACRGE